MYHICVSSGKEMKSRMVTLWSMEDFEARSVARMIIWNSGFLHPTRVGFPAKTYQELADEYLYMYHYMYTYIVYVYIYTHILCIYIYIYMYMYIIYIYIGWAGLITRLGRIEAWISIDWHVPLVQGIPRSIGDGWCHVTSTIVTGGWTNIIYDQHIPTL